MGSTYQLIFDGTPATDDVYAAVSKLEVEESVDLPGAVRLSMPVNRSDAGDLTRLSDPAFRPLANVAVVATPDGGDDQCIFDGYVLSQRIHLEAAVSASSVEVWGQDCTWLMNLEEKVREWVDVTDADVAGTIFGRYGIDPAPANAADAGDSPTHPEDGHTLMQRGTDIQFLRRLARRGGNECRVACGSTPGRRVGYFASAAVDADPVVTFVLTGTDANVGPLDVEWDVARPTAVVARQATFTDADPDGVSGDTADGGLTPLADRPLAAFAGRPMTALLAAPVDDAGELAIRARSVLRETGWFVRCKGDADVSRLGVVLRAGTVVEVDGIGSVHSGNYYVWSVRHTITADAHAMRFTLVRNAVGADPAGNGGGPLGGLL